MPDVHLLKKVHCFSLLILHYQRTQGQHLIASFLCKWQRCQCIHVFAATRPSGSRQNRLLMHRWLAAAEQCLGSWGFTWLTWPSTSAVSASHGCVSSGSVPLLHTLCWLLSFRQAGVGQPYRVPASTQQLWHLCCNCSTTPSYSSLLCKSAIILLDRISQPTLTRKEKKKPCFSKH